MKPLRIAIRSFADFQSALAAQIAAYRELHPEVEVEVVAFDLPSLEDAVLGANGLRSGEWDLAIFPTDWIGSAINTGTSEHLTPWMQSNPLPDWPEGWPASLREPLRHGDDFYCIPWHDGPECLIYRKDLFENPEEKQAFANQFGRELKPPITWQEFHETARFFTRPSQSLYGTLFAAYPDGHNTLYDLVLQVWSRGGELYTSDGLPTLNHPTVIEALDYYRGIINDPQACYPEGHKIDSISSGDVFLSGQVAMMANWFGFAARSSSPESPLRGKLALAPIPGGKPGQTASLSTYWVIAIGTGSRAKPASYELLRHIASAPSDKLTTLHGAVGVRLTTWNDPEVIERVPIYAQLEQLSAAARTLPFCEDLPKLAEIVNQVTVEVLTTNEPSETILNRAQTIAISRGLRLTQQSSTQVSSVGKAHRQKGLPMKAVVLRGPGKIVIEDRPEPTPSEGHVLLKVNMVGLCGSDLNSYRGKNPMVSFPRIPGHEISATVVEGAASFKLGDQVTLSPYTSCGNCAACLRGRPNACENNQTLGVQRDGGLTEYLVAPPEKLYTANLSLKELCLVEPLTVGFHAVARGRVICADTVAIIGCGGVGLGAVAAAAFRGARTIGIDLDDAKLDIARKAGAAELINTSRDDLHRKVSELTDGLGPDVIIEAIGLPGTFRAAVEEVAFTGRVVYIGYAKEQVAYETRLFVQKEIDILGSRNALPEDFREVIRMLEEHRFPVEDAVSKIVPLEETPEAIAAWSADPARFTKIMIQVG
jgi:threonine dehydrogenase-like Zn-dependent dehydrogenase/ABC-type glycerol-3-phosphate transport system substrate-binding protein